MAFQHDAAEIAFGCIPVSLQCRPATTIWELANTFRTRHRFGADHVRWRREAHPVRPSTVEPVTARAGRSTSPQVAVARVNLIGLDFKQRRQLAAGCLEHLRPVQQGLPCRAQISLPPVSHGGSGDGHRPPWQNCACRSLQRYLAPIPDFPRWPYASLPETNPFAPLIARFAVNEGFCAIGRVAMRAGLSPRPIG